MCREGFEVHTVSMLRYIMECCSIKKPLGFTNMLENSCKKNTSKKKQQ